MPSESFEVLVNCDGCRTIKHQHREAELAEKKAEVAFERAEEYRMRVETKFREHLTESHGGGQK